MMDNDELQTYRKTAPDTPEEWQGFWRAKARADRAHIVTGPAVAFAVNWKGWLWAVGLFFILRRNELPALLDMITGAGK